MDDIGLVINYMWNKLTPDEKFSLMKKASGLKNPEAVRYWKNTPEHVFEFVKKAILALIEE